MIVVTRPTVLQRSASPLTGSFKNSLGRNPDRNGKAFQLSFISMSEAILVAIQLVSIVIIRHYHRQWRPNHHVHDRPGSGLENMQFSRPWATGD